MALTPGIKFRSSLGYSIHWKNLFLMKNGGGVLLNDYYLVQKITEKWGSYGKFKEI